MTRRVIRIGLTLRQIWLNAALKGFQMSVPPPTVLPDSSPTATPVPPAAEKNNVKAIIWMLISVAGASAMTIGVRQASLSVDSRMIVLFRAAISTIFILIAIGMFAKLRGQMRFTRPWLHLFRGGLIAFSTQLGFYTIANIPIATATVLFFMGPIFATIFSSVLHSEHVGPRRWAAVAAGFIGAVIVLRPGFAEFHPAMLTALGSSLLFALALTLSRQLASADGPLATYFSSVVITAIITIPLAAPVFSIPVGGMIWLALSVVIITSAVRGYADIEAYRYGESAILAPVAYLRLVLISIAGYFMFDEVPDMATIIGAALIISATLYIALREAKLRRANR
jgi:drug/metabolite transporter (DMT)-like permease